MGRILSEDKFTFSKEENKNTMEKKFRIFLADRTAVG
jgi:hypothetical protein